MTSNEDESIMVEIPQNMLDKIDEEISKGKFKNREEYVLEALRFCIESENKESDNTQRE